jgi:membrane fusion protein, multidrug efflux system
MSVWRFRKPLLWAGVALAVTAAAATGLLVSQSNVSHSNSPATGQPAATPVSAAVVEQRDVTLWDEFSGRLEAVERVEVRSRVSGAVLEAHFREGALVKKGDLLVTIDPAPYAAEVQRAEAQVAAAQARLALANTDLDRGRQLWDSRTVSTRELDQRLNGQRESEANLKAAEAALQSARLNLEWTEVRAPVAGRVGKLEITVGNLVAAGPGAPVLTTLVSVDPIYASFNADEQVVMRALAALGPGAAKDIGRVPVQMLTVTSENIPFEGKLQLIDNQVDAKSGTVRVRAQFDNAQGALMPGQFARIRMGQVKTEPALMVNERAIGTDQDKKFVMVVGRDNKAEYREVTLGAFADGLRIVKTGLRPGENVIVNGLQRVRPGAVVAPERVAMSTRPELQAQTSSGTVSR